MVPRTALGRIGRQPTSVITTTITIIMSHDHSHDDDHPHDHADGTAVTTLDA